jgi:hypothetical protein
MLSEEAVGSRDKHAKRRHQLDIDRLRALLSREILASW